VGNKQPQVTSLFPFSEGSEIHSPRAAEVVLLTQPCRFHEGLEQTAGVTLTKVKYIWAAFAPSRAVPSPERHTMGLLRDAEWPPHPGCLTDQGHIFIFFPNPTRRLQRSG
jgi:hypothetical protein